MKLKADDLPSKAHAPVLALGKFHGQLIHIRSYLISIPVTVGSSE